MKKKGTLGSPYSIRDYYAIDRNYGTKNDFRRLIDEAHNRKMKVFMDIVANHASWDSVMMEHPDFYKHDGAGNIIWPHEWTDVAALNYANAQLRRYMTDMILYWLKDFHVDGFRCDAAAEVPTDFWEQTRRELEKGKQDIVMLAEADKPDLLRSAFDFDYGWPLMAEMTKVVERGTAADGIEKNIEQQSALFPKGALHMLISDELSYERRSNAEEFSWL